MEDFILKKLHQLPPETAHKITFLLMKIVRFLPKKKYKQTTTPLFGKDLPNPIGLAAGMDKNGVALKGWEKLGFSFVEVGTVTCEKRAGNKGKRLWRLPPDGIVNFMGLNNAGMAKVYKNIASYRSKNMAVGVSITSLSSSTEELAQLTQTFADIVDYFSVNVACPNVEHEKSFIEEAVAQVPTVIQYAKGTPVLVKLPPIMEEGQLRNIVSVLDKMGVRGFIATNTQPFENHESVLGHNMQSPWPVKKGKQVGGYSGAYLLPVTTQMVKTIRQTAGKDSIIIGVGGIQSDVEAKQVMAAGANAVQLYTGLVYQGPKLVKEIAQAL